MVICKHRCPSVRPSVYLSVVILTQLLLIGFLPNFINGLLSPTSRSSLKTGFCPTADSQDGRQNGRHLSTSAVVVTLTQSFLIRFLPNFIYESLSSPFRSSSNMGFVRHTITKMADKMAMPINVCCRGHSNLVIFYRISSKFYILITFIKLSIKFEYGFCLTNDNQDG